MEILGKWYESPPHKFWAMQHMEKNLVRLLNVKKREMGMGTHQEYYSPRVLSASKMIEFAYETEPARMAAETNEFYQALKSV